jgi:hypothetical protein
VILNSDGKIIGIITKDAVNPDTGSAPPNGSDLLEQEPSTLSGIIADRADDIPDSVTSIQDTEAYAKL